MPVTKKLAKQGPPDYVFHKISPFVNVVVKDSLN